MPVFAKIKDTLTALNHLGTGNEKDPALPSYDPGSLHGRVVRQNRNHLGNYPVPSNPDCTPFSGGLPIAAPESCVTRLTYSFQDGSVDCEVPGDCSQHIRGYWVTSQSDCFTGSFVGAKAFNEQGEVTRIYQLYVSYPQDVESCRKDNARGQAGGECHPCTNLEKNLLKGKLAEATRNQTALDARIQDLEGKLQEASNNQTALNSQVQYLEKELQEASNNQTALNLQIGDLEVELAEAAINQTGLRRRITELDVDPIDCTMTAGLSTISSSTNVGWLGALAVAPIGVGAVALGVIGHYIYRRFWGDSYNTQKTETNNIELNSMQA